MWQAREHGPVIQAAERAAEPVTTPRRKSFCARPLASRRASVGPRHPDLANTLNNLGIVCEITGKPDDAEQYFRRAVSIAQNVTGWRTIRLSPPVRKIFVTFVRLGARPSNRRRRSQK